MNRLQKDMFALVIDGPHKGEIGVVDNVNSTGYHLSLPSGPANVPFKFAEAAEIKPNMIPKTRDGKRIEFGNEYFFLPNEYEFRYREIAAPTMLANPIRVLVNRIVPIPKGHNSKDFVFSVGCERVDVGYQMIGGEKVVIDYLDQTYANNLYTSQKAIAKELQTRLSRRGKKLKAKVKKELAAFNKEQAAFKRIAKHV